MTKSTQDFAQELTAIVDASAQAFATLNRVLEQQQQSILALASTGGVRAPSLSPVARIASPEPAPDTAPAAEASPEAVLSEAEKVTRDLLHHSPELALANLYQVSSHAVGLALLSTATAQQQLAIIAQAVVTRSAAQQLSPPRLEVKAPPAKAGAPADARRVPAKNARAR